MSDSGLIAANARYCLVFKVKVISLQLCHGLKAFMWAVFMAHLVHSNLLSHDDSVMNLSLKGNVSEYSNNGAAAVRIQG